MWFSCSVGGNRSFDRQRRRHALPRRSPPRPSPRSSPRRDGLRGEEGCSGNAVATPSPRAATRARGEARVRGETSAFRLQTPDCTLHAAGCRLQDSVLGRRPSDDLPPRNAGLAVAIGRVPCPPRAGKHRTAVVSPGRERLSHTIRRTRDRRDSGSRLPPIHVDGHGSAQPRVHADSLCDGQARSPGF
jgi:hypothetical protein